VWDVRAFKKPLLERDELTTLYPQTNAIFSPDEKYVLTGTAASVRGQRGRLVFLKRDTLEVVRELGMESSVVKVAWHSKINQVRDKCIDYGTANVCMYMLGCTDSGRNGERGDIGAVLTRDVDERGEAAGEQGAAAETRCGGHGGVDSGAADLDPALAADVPRGGLVDRDRGD
jgi:hypothetical protein